MSNINTDEFFADSAKILTVLHSAFPQPIILQVDDICGAEETDEYGMHSPRYLACFSAMLWLAEEGYLRFVETIRSEAIDQAVLTARCFVLLTKPDTKVFADQAALSASNTDLPDSVALERSSLSHQLRSVLRPRNSLTINSIMMQLMSTMLEGKG